MPKIKKISELVELMEKKEQIRNIGIIAHIDHGKTTMTDSLLAEAGLLSPTLAGQARALDYLEEEQKRGITIKMANISLLHEVGGRPYVINLIDTPGHVDFTGKVTRALRAIDGAVVVVDAVEEVMVQTETVTRQALEERVKPVLFINKIDRLIRELKLTPDQIQKKLARTIRSFNTLIDLYGDPDVRDKWKVSAEGGTVTFGSALHRWGFNIKMMQERGLKFSDILEFYKTGKWEKELSKLLPLHEAVLGMVVNNLPTPLEAQPFRIPKIWEGSMESDTGKAMADCNEGGPIVMCVNKVIVDPHAGVVCTGRVFSGTIHKGDEIYSISSRKKYRVQQVGIYMGAFRQPVDAVSAGNIAALLGLDDVRAGDTIVLPEYAKAMVPFERIKYVSEPVITIAIEPERPRDLPSLINAMHTLSVEDPNLVVTINQETGEYLLSGMGELHLEITCKWIRENFKIPIKTSSPTVVYRETITKTSPSFMGKSPNKHNKIWFEVEKLDGKVVGLIKSGEISELRSSKAMAKVLREEAGWPTLEARNVVGVSDHLDVLVDATKGAQYLREVMGSIRSAFHWICKEGPLAEERLREVKVRLIKVLLHEDPAHRGPAQMMPATRQAIFAALLSAEPTLLEPIYKIQVRIPPDQLGAVTGLVTSKRGAIVRVEQKGPIQFVTGHIPVAETLGLASEMRAATSGTAFWQLTFDHWARVPKSLEPKVVAQIRKRKGLPPEVPKAERYIVRE